MKTLFSLVVLLFMFGCSSTNQLALYKLSQSELNQQLNAQLLQRLTPITLAGVPLQFRAITLQSEIAPAGRQVVQLQLATDMMAKVSVLQLPIAAVIAVEAEPYFDQKRQAVYLRQFKLLDANIAAAGYAGKLKPLSAELQLWLQNWLAEQPVYRLNPERVEHQLLLKMPLKIQLQPGQMLLTPAFE